MKEFTKFTIFHFYFRPIRTRKSVFARLYNVLYGNLAACLALRRDNEEYGIEMTSLLVIGI